MSLIAVTTCVTVATCSAKVGYQLGYVLAAAEYLPTEFNVDAGA
jgi:hypothetical protein